MVRKIGKALIAVLFILLTGASILTSYLLLYYQTHAFPNTHIGSIPVSSQTRAEILETMSSLSASPVSLVMKDRTYEYTLPMIGVTVSSRKTINEVFEPNSLTVIPFIRSLINSIHRTRIIQPDIVTNEAFREFTSTIHSFSDQTDDLALDPSGQRFEIIRKEDRYTIDPVSLKNELSVNITNPNHVYAPRLLPALSTRADDVKQYNELLTAVYDDPMTVTVTDGLVNRSITIPPLTLKSVFMAQYDRNLGKIGFSLKNEEFLTLIKPLYAGIKLSPDVSVPDTDAKRLLTEAMVRRAEGSIASGAILGAAIGPNTDGTKGDKYIEVDISQQRMYLFDRGSMAASFRVSTGKYLPTPTGEFRIMNKARSGAYSNIYHVYMPFWMAFYYKDAYYGIHELPYYYSPDGKKIQRPREFIGSPNTGGCVALDIGDAQKVFEFGEVGMKVVIYP